MTRWPAHKLFASSVRLLIPVIFFCVLPLHAANKVVLKPFNWQISSTDHFDVYHYGPSGRALVPYASACAEDAYARVSRFLPLEKAPVFPLFLYNSHNDFEQSAVTDISEGVGGVTEAFKNRLMVGHTGSRRYLRYLICHEFAHEAEFHYLFGGFWRSLQLVKFLVYPSWMMEGLAEYGAGDMDPTVREMYLRDAATSGGLLPMRSLENFNHVLPHQVTLAYKQSEAFIRFIVAEYGEDKLAQALRLFAEYLDADTVLHKTLGATLGPLDKKFQTQMKETYARAAQGLAEPAAFGERLTHPGVFPRFCESAVFSPDGKSIAYISDERGVKEMYLFDPAARASRRLVDMTRRPRVENIHTDGRGLGFSPDGRFIVFAAERVQRDRIAVLDIRTRRLKLYRPDTESVDSPVFSADGNIIFFAGLKGGARDLFSFNLRTRATTRLTDDPCDDIDLALAPDGSALLFAAEREHEGRLQYDLCRLPVAGGPKEWLTATPGDERFPAPAPDGGILYTADHDGVYNLYYSSPGAVAPRRLTRVIGGAFQPQASPDGARLLFSSFRAGQKHLYLGDLHALAGTVDDAVAPSSAAVPGAPFLSMNQTADTMGPARPYRFRASTDLFFPLLFYSSSDGWYVAGYWQASDMMGYHQVQAMATHAGSADYTDFSVTYGFLKYRSQFYVNARGTEDYRDINRTIRRRQYAQSVMMLYPFNRFDSAGIAFETIDRRERLVHSGLPEARARENAVGLIAEHTTLAGAYCEVTAGRYAALETAIAGPFAGSDYTYQSFAGDISTFRPLGREHTLLWKTSARASYGPDAEAFSLGGLERLRGLSAGDIWGEKMLVTTLEWRFPLVHNINYNMYYLFPGLFFKSLYGGVFTDGGFAFRRDEEFRRLTGDYWKGGGGLALRCHTFVLQTFPMTLSLQWAWRMDRPVPVTYFSAGSAF